MQTIKTHQLSSPLPSFLQKQRLNSISSDNILFSLLKETIWSNLITQTRSLHAKHHLNMASLHILKSTLSPLSISPSKDFLGKSNYRKTIPKLRTFYGSSKRYSERQQMVKVFCSVQEEDNNQRNGEEPTESLFMKELKRRGMNPTSLLEETNRGNYGVEDEMKIGEEDRGFSKRNSVSTELDKSLSNQRERSMALNSEGLEGLIPRAKLLLTLGGTFFLGFWPLILITVALFSCLYFYFGPSFIHDGSNASISPPPYIDPYELLEDERISQIAPSLK
ncbi:hypothetical protein OIU77_028696 [Salix suchowensis]|uniref:Uncharacterized protein n=1 Tax=Salix suchowensis TaxID=1278906 RepID=A0ABQ9BIE7_9ROSI|nr:hypothetical protein OIU77_028696 [Salix suchowensis]